MNVSTDERELRVLLGTSKTLPFGENVPTNILESSLSLVLGQLVYSSGSFEVEPGLVEKWSYDYEKKEYLLNLRPGLRFHNGRNVTAQDLEFSLVRHLVGQYGSWFRSFFSNIEGVEELEVQSNYEPNLVKGIRVKSDLTLLIKLKRSNPSFMHSLARSSFSLVPREELENDLVTWKSVPIGAGNYQVVFADSSTGRVEVRKVFGSGPKRIKLFMDGEQDVDLSLLGPKGRAMNEIAVNRPSGVTVLSLNYEKIVNLNPKFRRYLRNAIDPKATAYHSIELQPLDQLLPKHFWGRAKHGFTQETARGEVEKYLSNKYEVAVYDSGANSPNFFSFLSGLREQLQNSGLQIEFRIQSQKFSHQTNIDHLGRISTIGSDVMDPLILFSVYRPGSPLKPYVPPVDSQLEKLFEEAGNANQRESRESSVQALAQYFENQNYVIPLFERTSTIAFDPNSIDSLGDQNGSLIFYFDRVEMK